MSALDTSRYYMMRKQYQKQHPTVSQNIKITFLFTQIRQNDNICASIRETESDETKTNALPVRVYGQANTNRPKRERTGRTSATTNRQEAKRKTQEMIQATETALRAILNADPSMTPELISATIRTAKGKGQGITEREPLDRPMKTAEVARHIGKTAQMVREYCRRGLLRRITPPGFTRPVGISEQSVRDFLAGKFPAEAAQETGTRRTNARRTSRRTDAKRVKA